MGGKVVPKAGVGQCGSQGRDEDGLGRMALAEALAQAQGAAQAGGVEAGHVRSGQGRALQRLGRDYGAGGQREPGFEPETERPPLRQAQHGQCLWDEGRLAAARRTRSRAAQRLDG